MEGKGYVSLCSLKGRAPTSLAAPSCLCPQLTPDLAAIYSPDFLLALRPHGPVACDRAAPCPAASAPPPAPCHQATLGPTRLLKVAQGRHLSLRTQTKGAFLGLGCSSLLYEAFLTFKGRSSPGELGEGASFCSRGGGLYPCHPLPPDALPGHRPETFLLQEAVPGPVCAQGGRTLAASTQDCSQDGLSSSGAKNTQGVPASSAAPSLNHSLCPDSEPQAFGSRGLGLGSGLDLGGSWRGQA